jgi:citrate lyase beta subunit
VAAATSGFTPPKDEVERASRILTEFQSSRQQGISYPVIEGRAYDEFKAECLRQTAAFAEACAARDTDKRLAREKGASQ